MFPTRVRCSSVSLPYHLGNGWFGGLLPAASLAIATRTGHPQDGLWDAARCAEVTKAQGITAD